jgi:predicted adenine nucleotide alpha hydrolase (AANH) superfamily ATPase
MKILLHICCGNCAISPVQMMQGEGHTITGFWFNPNIHPYKEYRSRLDSLKLLSEDRCIDMHVYDGYEPASFFSMFPEPAPPFPERCTSCYTLRLEKTAWEAAQGGFDAFSTTLLISPYQGFDQISYVGNRFAEKYNVAFYLRDFRPHFRQSLSVAQSLGLYRQKYCGCIFSREERLKKNQESKIKN